MDETTSQGTLQLPRRLPKQPNQAVPPQKSVPVAPSRTNEFVLEEFVPVFESEPRPAEPEWPEFPPPQEFTTTEEFYAPPQEFTPTEEVPVPLPQEFILPDVTSLPPHPFSATPKAPTVSPASAAPEFENVRDAASSDSKPGIVSAGDPKPAFARPSGPSRSRPSRPSGNFASARVSGAYAIPETGKSSFVVNEQRRSGEFASASIPTADVTPRSSREVSSISDFSQQASPSRIATTAHKRPAPISAVPALIVLSVLLVSYSFAVGPIESYLELLLGGSAEQPNALITLVPWISLAPVILLLGGVLWIIAGLIGLRHAKPRTKTIRPTDDKPSSKRKKERRKSPLELFREEAAKEDIDGTAAYQAWRLLQPFGPDTHVLSVYDKLEGTLGMRPKDIQSVYQQLVPAEYQEERFRFRTVLDLLRIVRQVSLSKP